MLSPRPLQRMRQAALHLAQFVATLEFEEALADPLPISLTCPACQHGLLGAAIVTCCGATVCSSCCCIMAGHRCWFCGASGWASFPNRVIATLFEELPVRCPWGCELPSPMPVGTLPVHATSCPFCETCCIYASVGCPVRGSRELVCSHIKHCPLTSLARSMSSLMATMSQTAEEMKRIRQGVDVQTGAAALPARQSAWSSFDSPAMSIPQAIAEARPVRSAAAAVPRRAVPRGMRSQELSVFRHPENATPDYPSIQLLVDSSDLDFLGPGYPSIASWLEVPGRSESGEERATPGSLAHCVCSMESILDFSGPDGVAAGTSVRVTKIHRSRRNLRPSYDTVALPHFTVSAGVGVFDFRVESLATDHDLCMGVVDLGLVNVGEADHAWMLAGGFILTTRDGQCWTGRRCFGPGLRPIGPGATVACVVDFDQRMVGWMVDGVSTGLAFSMPLCISSLSPVMELLQPGESVTFLGHRSPVM